MRTLTRDGVPIAWLSRNACTNPECRKAHFAGRPVHITPAHTDPRANDFTLVLPDYHFETEDEAVAALDSAWATAEVANNVTERDDAYSRHVAVKIRKGSTR